MSNTLPSPSAIKVADPLSSLLSSLLRQGRTVEALSLLDSVPDAGARAVHLADALANAARLPRSGATVASLLSQLLLTSPDQPEAVAAASAAAVNFLVGLSKKSGALYAVLSRLSDRRIADAFRCCAEAGQEDVALRLLPHLPVPSLSAPAQWLALAAERGLLRLLDGLLSSSCLQAAPAAVNAEDADGRTALAAACLAGQAGAVRLLLERGSADPGRADRDGRTCQQLLLEAASAAAGSDNVAVFNEIASLLDTAECLGSTQSERVKSQQLHSFLTRCGFTARRAELHCEAADFLLHRIARPLAADSRSQLACHLVGSFSEGWGVCMVQANGRAAVDSDVNWLMGPGPSTNESEPAPLSREAQAGTLVRIDWQTDSRRQNQHEMARIAQLLRAGGGNSSSGGLQVRQTRELPACFVSQERRLMRCLSTVQGQVFTIVKIVFKRMLPSMGAAGLTSYHAKTVLFFLLSRHSRCRGWWEPENLLPLVRKALNLTLELLELDARSCVAMPHFFAENCHLAFRDPLDDTKTRVRESIKSLCSDPQKIDGFLRGHLRPISSQSQPMYFHPFTLLPAESFCSELMPSSDSAGAGVFADVYPLVQQCLMDLSSTADPAVRESRLTRIRCLPAWCLCTRQCLTALTLLSLGDRLRAAKVLTAQVSHRIQRCWDTERCCFFGGLLSGGGAGGGVFHANPSNCGDWGWRFCFSSRVQVALQKLPLFTQTLLQPRQDSLNRLYVNFRSISWSLMAELLPKHMVSPADWYTELKFDPDHQELLTLAHYSDSPLHLHFCRTMLEELRDRSRLDLNSDIESVRTKLNRLTRGSDGWNDVKLRPKRMGLSVCRN